MGRWFRCASVPKFQATRNHVPFEHIELATILAEALGAEHDLHPEPVTPGEVEAAYLRRMKAGGAELQRLPRTSPCPTVPKGNRPRLTGWARSR
ncbi:MAG: hypothetical protein HS126_37150 [Anaerolineales bacterium]|nr:hypothetical protein [Anaerolineales bacterium]